MELAGNMDALIVEAIQHIKARKKRASMDLILYKLKKENSETNVEDFKHYFDKLESCGIIVNKKPNTENGSYVICDEKTLAEKYVDNAVIKVLKEEINFLKDEITEKNLIIKKLLTLNEAERMKTIGLSDNNNIGSDTEDGDGSSASKADSLLNQDGNCKQRESDKLVNQLSMIRKANHEQFLHTKTNEQIKCDEEVMEVLKDNASEKKVVTEKRANKKKNACVYPGCVDGNKYGHTDEPKHLILHASSNEKSSKTGQHIMPEQLLHFKMHIEKNIPHTTVLLP